MSDKTKKILRRIIFWAVLVVITFLLAWASGFYLKTHGGSKDGVSAVCGPENSETYQNKAGTVQEVFFSPSDWSETSFITGKFVYDQDDGRYYLREGIFLLPLDIATCQGLEKFKEGMLVTALGKVVLDGENPVVVVEGLGQTVPPIFKTMYNAAVVLVMLGFYFAFLTLLFLIVLLVKLIACKIKHKKFEVKERKERGGNSLALAVLAVLFWFGNPIVSFVILAAGVALGIIKLKSLKSKLNLLGLILCSVEIFVVVFLFIAFSQTAQVMGGTFFSDAGATSNKPTGQEILQTKPYLSQEYKISLNLPLNWTVDEKSTSEAALFFRGPEINDSTPEIRFSLVAAAPLDISDSEGAMKFMLAALENAYEKFETSPNETYRLSGGRLEARLLDFTYLDKGKDSHGLALLTVKNGLLYALGAKASSDKWNQYQDAMRRSLLSFRVTETAYVNDMKKFSLVVPDGWLVDDSGGTGLPLLMSVATADQINGQPFYTNINLTFETGQTHDWRDVYTTVQNYKYQLPQFFPDFSFIEDSDLTTGRGQYMYLLGGTYKRQGIEYRLLAAIAAGEKGVYVLTGTSSTEFWDYYDQAIRTSLQTMEIFGPDNLESFADCLKNKKVILYEQLTPCPACLSQKRSFGAAASRLSLVECYVPENSYVTAECQDKDINAFPTWEFADGSRLVGVQTLDTLVAKTGCTLPK